MIRRAGLAAFALVLAARAGAADRSISWDKLAVEAKIDADGNLHVEERQVISLTGDWPRIVRRFALAPGQTLEFEESRLLDAATREPIPGASTLLETLPALPFSPNTSALTLSAPALGAPGGRKLEYTIRFVVTPGLQRQADHYLLDFDFAWPGRGGPILDFDLSVEEDAAWKPLAPLYTGTIPRPLPAGQGVRVERPYARSAGAPAPPEMPRHVPRGLGAEIWSGAAAAAAVLWILFWRRERGLGRFDPASTVLVPAALSERAEKLKREWSTFSAPPALPPVLRRFFPVAAARAAADSDQAVGSPIVTGVLILAGVALLVAAVVREATTLSGAVGGLKLLAILYALGLSQAYFWRRRFVNVKAHALRFGLPIAAMLAFVATRMTSPPFELAGVALLAAGATASILNLAATRWRREDLSRARVLAAARDQVALAGRKDDPLVAALGLEERMKWKEATAQLSPAKAAAARGSGPRERVRLMIPAQSGFAVRRRGALRGLWRDLSDRSASGDAGSLLSKYGPGLGPGCMGIPFLGVGILVMVLVSKQAAAQGNKEWMPIAFGAVFALAGVFLITTGVSSILGRAAQGVAASRSAHSWEADYPWDREGARTEGAGSVGFFAASIGRILIVGFIGLFNVFWTVPMPVTTRLWVSAIVLIFDLLALAVVYDTVLRIWLRLTHGRPRLTWKRIPVKVGERFEATFSPGHAIHMTGPAQVELTCVDQVPENSGGQLTTVCYGTSAARQTIAPPADGRRVATLEISLDVPADLPGTRLSAPPAEVRFWRLTVIAPVLGPDVSAAFLVPIYAAADAAS